MQTLLNLFIFLPHIIPSIHLGIPLDVTIILISSFLLVQSIFTLIWMLYAWENPKNSESHKAPIEFIDPKYSFTALIPARHEEKVITDTIKAINSIDYPTELKEAIILCKTDDIQTIQKAKQVITQLNNENIRLVTFDSFPVNKPHALNIGLEFAKGDIIAVFDAEDEPSKAIYNIANTVLLRDNVDVVQGGVQLMNYSSYWFSAMNVLEYFFWFKSGLQFFTNVGHITPLGGNTVFIKRDWLRKVGGWNDNCLTEDADLGIQLSLSGAKTKVIYDEAHATKEETPSSLFHLIRQRTRWNQGFLQIFMSKKWLKFRTTRQKFFAIYIFLSPEIQALFFLYLPFAVWLGLTHKILFIISLFSFMPLYIFLLQAITYAIGFFMFTKAYNQKFTIFGSLILLPTFVIYQITLSYSAIRAMYRMFCKRNTWEKTAHVNNHRLLVSEPIKSYA